MQFSDLLAELVPSVLWPSNRPQTRGRTPRPCRLPVCPGSPESPRCDGSRRLIAAVVMDDRLADDGAERGHSLRQPRRNTPAMKRKICTASASRHFVSRSTQDSSRSLAWQNGPDNYGWRRLCREQGVRMELRYGIHVGQGEAQWTKLIKTSGQILDQKKSATAKPFNCGSSRAPLSTRFHLGRRRKRPPKKKTSLVAFASWPWRRLNSVPMRANAGSHRSAGAMTTPNRSSNRPTTFQPGLRHSLQGSRPSQACNRQPSGKCSVRNMTRVSVSGIFALFYLW
jgi:hypothetical protein